MVFEDIHGKVDNKEFSTGVKCYDPNTEKDFCTDLNLTFGDVISNFPNFKSVHFHCSRPAAPSMDLEKLTVEAHDKAVNAFEILLAKGRQ